MRSFFQMLLPLFVRIRMSMDTVFAVLFALKVSGVSDIHWVWVFAPIWGTVILHFFLDVLNYWVVWAANRLDRLAKKPTQESE